MHGAAKCVLSVIGASIRWSTTDDGSLSILISYAKDSPGGIQRTGALDQSSPWIHSECTGSYSNTITFEVRPQDGNAQDSDNDQARKLREKIDKKWEKTLKPLQGNSGRWSKNPDAFFGNAKFSSSKQWSYHTLRDSDDRLQSYSNPFHKVNLANHEEEHFKNAQSINPSFLRSNCRKTILEDLHPGLSELEEKNRWSTYKTFERFINQGQTLQKIMKWCPGLLLTVAPIFSRHDLEFISKRSDLDWLSPEKLNASKGYTGLTLSLFTYMRSVPDNLTDASVTLQERGFGPNGPSSTRSLLFIAERPQSPSFEISYGTPLLRLSRAGMSQPEAVAHFSPNSPISSLFHAMGGRIPKLLFDRATCPQRRMNEYGKCFEVTRYHAGLHQDIVDLLDANALKHNIEHLLSLSIIAVEDSAYVWDDESAQSSFEQSKSLWIHQAFRLCCYVFPRSPIVDPSFSSTGKELLDVLRHLLRLYAETGLELPHCKDTVETLLAASKLEGLDVKERLLTMASNSESPLDQTHLRAEIVYEWSVVFRCKGRVFDSERVIQEFLQPRSLNIWTLPLGRLCISQAYNQVYHFNFGGAREALQWNPLQWNPPNRDLSEGATYLLRDQLCCNGRIFRGEGRFGEAKECFEGCLRTVPLPESKRLLIISHLSDLCCELDYIQQSKPSQTTMQIVYLEERQEIVQREIDRVRGSNRHSKGLRRLLLSLIEVEIRQNHLNEAEKLTKEILNMYNKLTEPDIDDKVGHVRALIACARISPVCEAEERWMAALHQNKVYNPSEEEVFTCGVIYLSISSARLQLGRLEESRISFNQAIEVIARKRLQFLIPGIGTYLFDSVTSDMWSRAG